MSRGKQQSAFDQVSDFVRGWIVAYRDCGLFFRKIGSRVGRNQTTVIRICDHWMAWPQPYFNKKVRDYTWHVLSKGSSSTTSLIASLAGSLSGSFADRKLVVHGGSTIDPDYTPAATPDQLWQQVESALSALPQEHIQSLFESMPRRVAAVISNNGRYSAY
ncbi:uncharacterized protein TNCV_122321 [Trichonephila clavipes]|nr:uncharacterized protein TNCV_122321 [Trichonephila clavipes]